MEKQNGGKPMRASNRVKYAGSVVVMMILFLSGCGTKVQTLSYGKPVFENQSSVLVIPSAYTVTSFDGQPVKWTTSSDSFSLSEKVAEITVPSGTHNIAYSYYFHHPGLITYEHYSSGAVVQRRTGSSTKSFSGNVTINMLPGKRYIFVEQGIVIDPGSKQ